METKKTRLSRRKKKITSRLPEKGIRLLVSRSSKHLFAQLIDLSAGKTILGLSDKILTSQKEGKLTKTTLAEKFGEEFAGKAGEKNIKKVVFDRGGCLYHGRIKAFAEGARKGGLNF